MTELQRDPLGPLNRLLGYVIAIAAIAMLLYAVSNTIRYRNGVGPHADIPRLSSDVRFWG
jgi:hypothetical protein